MKYRRFGRTELNVSSVSLGGAYIGGRDTERMEQNAIELVSRAWEAGCNYIDTAPLYGDSERLLGQAFSVVNKPFFIATKVGFKPEGFDYKRDSVLTSLERSLGLLGVDKVTVAQIHEVNLAGWERIMEPGGALEGLREAQQRNLCEFTGITARAIPLLAELAETGEFDTVLCYHDYHPCKKLAAECVVPAASANDMGIVIATPLAGGIFVETEEQHEAVEQWFEEEDRPRVWGILKEMKRENSTLPQSAFRWILGDNRVSTVSSGSSNVAEWDEVVVAADMDVLRLSV